MIDNKTIWDVVVIGGGPAGMMAAGRAAEKGARVILIEKNKTFGRKLLLTGGGRCNLTNYEPEMRKLVEKYGDSGKFLFSAFSKWDVEKTLDFFHKRNLKTKVEEGGRIFPVSDKAESVLKVLINYLNEGGVKVLLGIAVKEIVTKENRIEAVQLDNGQQVCGKSFVLATGGKALPLTGSTGDGFIWLKNAGHTINSSEPSLVPISISDKWVKELQGTSLADVKITVSQDDVKHITKRGMVLFTHFGISGPTIINMSRTVGDLLKNGKVVISIDIFPSLGPGELSIRLQDLFAGQGNKKIKNVISSIFPVSTIVPAILDLSRINPDKPCNEIGKKERMALVHTIKNIPMQVEGLLGINRSIATSGGLSPTEVDFKTMRSRIIPNLYLSGDILDIDRQSGGYSLQICWTTGYIAGNSSI